MGTHVRRGQAGCEKAGCRRGGVEKGAGAHLCLRLSRDTGERIVTLYAIVNLVIIVVFGLLARAVSKPGEGAGGGWNFRYSNRDIVIIAIIAAIAGVVNTGTGNVWYLANSSLGPLGGALLKGAFMWAYVLAVWLLRKPGGAVAAAPL